MSYSDLLRIELITTGTQAGVWGNTTNTNLGTVIEDAIAGYTTVSVATSPHTLSENNGAADEARMAMLEFTGATGAFVVNAPANVSKLYTLLNSTAYAGTIQITGGAGVGISIPAGKIVSVWTDGTDFFYQNTHFGNISAGTVTANLTGNVTGDVTGDLTGDVTGNVTGNVTGDVTGDLTGTVAGAAVLYGSSSTLACQTSNIAEGITVSATAATGTINYDVTTQSVLYYTSNASANWTVNFRGSSGTSLNTLMSTGQAITVVFMVTQGSTAYYNSAITIDGTSVTPKYVNGVAWVYGNPSGIDSYTYTIIKTGSAAFTVLAAQTQYK